MALKTTQMRYIADNDPRNYPKDLTAAMLTSGAFLDSSTRIVSLTIQGNLDLAFYLNDTVTPIRILPSDLKVDDHQKWCSDSITLPADAAGKIMTEITPIYSIRFDARSLKHFLDLNTKRTNSENYLFITYTYDTLI